MSVDMPTSQQSLQRLKIAERVNFFSFVLLSVLADIKMHLK